VKNIQEEIDGFISIAVQPYQNDAVNSGYDISLF